METFPYSVNVPDVGTIDVENWMIVMAFALKGVPWAVALADDPEYDLRGKYRDYQKCRGRYFAKKQITYHQNEIERLKKVIEDSI